MQSQEESNPAAEPVAEPVVTEEPASAITEGEENVADENPTAASDAEAPATTTEVAPSDGPGDVPAETSDVNVDRFTVDVPVTEEIDLDAPDEDDLDDEQLVELIAADPKKAAAELKKARKEAADNRVRARDAENNVRELFGEQADEEFVSNWAALGKAYAESGDDLEAQNAVRAIFADLAGVVPTTASPVSPAEQIDQLFARREAEHNRRLAEAALTIEMKELGYNTEPEPGSRDESRLNLLRAQIASQKDGERDLKKAHDAVEEYRQQIFEEKLAEARAANEGLPPVATGTGSAASTSAQDADKKKEKVDPYEATVNLYKDKKPGGGSTLGG